LGFKRYHPKTLGAALVDNYALVLGGYQQLGLGVGCIWWLENRRSLVRSCAIKKPSVQYDSETKTLEFWHLGE